MRSAKTGQPILTTYILYDVDLQADEPFRGVVDNAGHFGGMKRHFQAKCDKY